MYPSIKAAFSRSVITAIIKVEMKDSPGRSGGAGILSLYHCMGTSRTSLLVEQLFRGTPLKFNIQVRIEDLTFDAERRLFMDNAFPDN